VADARSGGIRPWLVAAVVLSACGGSGDDGTGTTDTTPDTVAAATTVPAPDPDITTVTGPVTWQTREVGTAKDAVDIVERDASDGFIFVVRRTGLIETWDRNHSRVATALDLVGEVSVRGERGLLGLDFAREAGGWIAYVSRSDVDGTSVLESYRVSEPGIFDETSRTVHLRVPQPQANHNGGDVKVGPDGMVYLALGDGGGAEDPERTGQDLGTLLGKILRIDPTPDGYDVPSDNPFVGVDGARGEIWSSGLRNPWRVEFDLDGNLWVADVGQYKREEVSRAPAAGDVPGGRGVNFGWSAWEGSRRFNRDQDAPDALVPVHEYSHGDDGCAISGGTVATSANLPARAGWYLYGDFCTGRLGAVRVEGGATAEREDAATGLGDIVAVRGLSRAVYVVTISGAIHLVTAAPV
jgi:glucose/arabinose dehydrogenase